MRKRAQAVDETRLRITEAAVRLHTSIGPAKTTLSAVAQEAGVSRVTLYRHFADEQQLFGACSAHWALHHPAPDPRAWRDHPPVAPRARAALGELYTWYADNAAALFLFQRDAAALPAEVMEGSRAAAAAMADALVAGCGLRGASRRRLRAAAGHVLSYSTWRSMAVEQGLGDDAVDLAVRFLLAAA